MGVKRLAAVAVSGVAAVILLAVAAWMLLGRDGNHPADSAVQIILPPQAVSDVAPPAAGSNSGAGAADDVADSEGIVVYITGAVVNPGVYAAPADQRLHAVLAMAGGPSDDADLTRVNLATHLTDATHYQIPSVNDAQTGTTPPSAEQATSVEPGSGATACAVPININTASAGCLETLPGIGAARSRAIVAHREEVGPFVTAEDIKAVSGIGDGIYRRIAEMISVADR